MTEDNHERKSDALIIELSANFKNLVERYERDLEERNQHERDNAEHTMRWRNRFMQKQNDFEQILNSIQPILNEFRWIKRAVAVLSGGAIAAAGKTLFDWIASHFKA